MRRVWPVLFVALSACVGSMQRAPKQIPYDGKVECTDSLATPIAATIVGVVSYGAAIYAGTHGEGILRPGGMAWIPLLGIVGTTFIVNAPDGYMRAHQCQVAKRRGAEQAALVRRKAEARAEAGRLWKRSAAAARADDCATVRELDPQIRDLDLEFHDTVFARDVAIARCLASTMARSH